MVTRRRLAEALHGLARRIDSQAGRRPVMDGKTLTALRAYYDNNSTVDDMGTERVLVEHPNIHVVDHEEFLAAVDRYKSAFSLDGPVWHG